MNNTVGLRPAFVLKNASVLFTSDNQKSTADVGGSSFGTFNAGSDILKLTLLDSSRSGFIANAGEGDVAAVAPGGSLNIIYEGAETGYDDYVSAMLTVGGTVYYASFKPDSTGEGTWTMTLPNDLIPGRSYVLKVFSEERNGVDYSDYASPMREITLNVITNDLQYALQAGTSVRMSVIIDALALSGEVTAVEVSDESLFSASVENGEWVVSSHQSFDAPQWMKVTINGIVYDITVTNVGGITTWAALQNELNQGGTVVLTGNLTAGTDDEALTVPSGVNVTLDLAGFTLDRGLWFSSARDDGCVIINNGVMTITDSSSQKTGKITGGNTLGDGGGISNMNSLTLAGGLLTSNTAVESGGGVWNQSGAVFTMSGGGITRNTAYGGHGGGVWNGGTMNMTGGEISSNTADSGHGGGVWNGGTLDMTGGSITFNISASNGGLYVSGDAVMKVSGSPVISDNNKVKTGGSESSNLFLDGNVLISITGKLNETANIYLSRSAGFGIFTSGYGANNAEDDPAGYFHSNNLDYAIKLENDEVKIDQKEDNSIHYIMRSWDGGAVVSTPMAVEEFTLMSEVPDANSSWQTGVYVVQGDVKCSKRLRLASDAEVTLVLCDGARLTMEKGIGVNGDSKLIICGQENDSGILDAKSGSDDAPIGADNKTNGGFIEIHGGHVIATATGWSTSAAIGGAKGCSSAGQIRIFGGQVDATAEGYGAGIGGGQDSTSPGIRIYDGTVNAASVSGAAIGTGDSVLTTNLDYNGDEIEIHGGVVTAVGGGAGIGGGNNVQNPNIIITGGFIRATSEANAGESAAGIGSGRYAEQSGNITIKNCEVIALSVGGAGIGAGGRADGGRITIENSMVSAAGTNGGAGIGGGKRGGNGGIVTIADSTVIAVATEMNEQDQMLNKFNQMAKNFAAHRHNRIALSVASMINFVGSIVFATTDDESGAGIGGGYNGIGGSVSITNSYVVASASVGNARAIGHGTGKSNSGTLQLDSLASVYTGKDEASAAFTSYEERESACQSNRYALILPCQHEGCSYIVTETTHTIVCTVCNGSFEPEPHVWQSIPYGKCCKVCGYRNETCTVHFNKIGNVCGTMEDVRVVKDEDYPLPECGFTAQDGKTFLEWNVKIGEADPVRRKPGELITVTADTTVTPIWRSLYTVTFDSDGGSETEPQTLLYGEKVTKPADPVKEGYTFQGWYQVMSAQGDLADHPYYFNGRVTDDITLKAVWEVMTEPAFTGHAVLLSGQIGLQFFLELPQGKTSADYPNSYVTFAGNKIDSSVHHPLPASRAVIDGQDTGRYEFIVNLSSIQMADQFTPTFHYSEGDKEKTVTGEAYAVKDYIDWALREGTSVLNNQQQAIIRTLADYGHYAQPYLSRQNGWVIGKNYAEMTTRVSDSFDYKTVKDAAENSAFSRTNPSNDVEVVNYRLTFGTQLTLTVRIKPANNQTFNSIRIDGTATSIAKSGEYYLVDFTNPYANQLVDSHTIVAGDCTIKVSPMSYVYEMLSRESSQDDLKNLMCALYNYAEACHNYH